MNIKQIVAIVGLIGLIATLILPFLNYTEDGQPMQASQTQSNTGSSTN
jgi:hypothetical protein